MEYTTLGRSGLKISRICLGTMNFGPFTREPDAFGIMDAALDAGINFFDTANLYGRAGALGAHTLPTDAGDTEAIIGRWFAQ